jgi:uncharacterized protein (DUF2252 family)
MNATSVEFVKAIGEVVIALGVVANIVISGLNKLDLNKNARDNADIKKGVNGQTSALVRAATDSAGQLASEVAKVVQRDTKDASQVAADEIARLNAKISELHDKFEAKFPANIEGQR